MELQMRRRVSARRRANPTGAAVRRRAPRERPAGAPNTSTGPGSGALMLAQVRCRRARALGARPDARLPRPASGPSWAPRGRLPLCGNMGQYQRFFASTPSAAIRGRRMTSSPPTGTFFCHGPRRSRGGGKQPQRAAQGLVAAVTDLGGVLRRWRLWLHEADLADQGHNGYYVIGEALRLAEGQEPGPPARCARR